MKEHLSPPPTPAPWRRRALPASLGLALAGWPHGASPPRPDAVTLTPRQADVLRRLMQGLPNKLIARKLGRGG